MGRAFYFGHLLDLVPRLIEKGGVHPATVAAAPAGGLPLEAPRQAEEVRADGYLGKPFDLDRLFDLVARYGA